ncbi:MAG: hypothetical protein K0R57_6503 [Paenibacillaceae bacterium]|jgi:hypothetical protein|nr:hypothetical protein [Paenibacillaceae bacterium]
MMEKVNDFVGLYHADLPDEARTSYIFGTKELEWVSRKNGD